MKKFTKKWLITGMITILIITGIVYFGITREEVGKVDKVSLRLAWFHYSGFAGYYIAEKKGFYEKENIDITIYPGGVDVSAVKMVASGSDTFGIGGAVEAILAGDKDIPIKTVATIFRKNPVVYISLKDSGITKPQNFIGKKVGMKYGLDTEIIYRALMKKLGINTEDIEEVPVKFDLTPFFRGEVDVWPGFAASEPLIIEKQGYEINLISASEYGVPMYAQAIFTTEDTINNKPDLVRRFLKATLQGWKYAVEHPEEAVDISLEYGEDLEREFETLAFNTTIPFVIPDNKSPVGWMEKEIWESMHNMLLDQGLIKKAIPLDKLYTTEFLEGIYGK